MDLVYNRAKYLINTQQLDLVNDEIKAMLVDENYVPDPDHAFVDENSLVSAVNFEVEGTGYEPGHGNSGRLVLVNKLWTLDNDTDKVRFFADDIVWNPINIPVGLVNAVILIREGLTGDDTSDMIAYVQSGGFPRFADGGQLLVRWSTNGILTTK